MVKKLFKHEISAYLRTWLPIQIILLAIAFFSRLIQIFESDNILYETIANSSGFFYTVAIIVDIVLTMIFAIQRFYKNLFTHEGYLTLTLPVTPSQHIYVKSTTAVIFTVLTVITVFISYAIATAGGVFVESMKVIGYFFGRAYSYAGNNMILYVIEFIITAIIGAFSSYMLYYTCIAIGQLFKKNRVIGAVGVYFIYYTATQIISTVISVILMTFGIGYAELIEEFITKHLYACIHAGLCSAAICTLIFTAVCFIITRYIMRNKLNLE